MNKYFKILILISVIASIILILLFTFNNKEKVKNDTESVKSKTEIVIKKNDEIKTQEIKQKDTTSKRTLDLKPRSQNNNKELTKYINQEIGISFEYPSYWHKSEFKSVDLKGNVNSVEIRLNDSILHSSLSVKFHPNPSGEKLYRYNLSRYELSKGNFKSDKKEISIDDNKGIFGISLRETDGKGHKLDPPEKLTVIYLLCEDLNGEIELNFRNNSNNQKSTDDFNEILKNFKILKK
ncbi:MAG: hypothetical protein DRI94_14545 [Bacteroidetes bacterium]|nr:MAG: hypothetical protein DRI94_14545 [Bacteroidota bacterium]